MRTAIVIGLLLLSGVAFAKDHAKWAGNPFSAWYESQKDSNGNSCCGEADAHDYWGGVQLLLDGSVLLDGNVKIGADKVLKGPNPTGHAVWWYNEGDGWHNDYCFSLPSMG